jgi:hypothetical protein
MVFGGNSDLFGRRWFVISGNFVIAAGYIAIGAAKNTETIIGGNTAIGVVSCQNYLLKNLTDILGRWALPTQRIRHPRTSP